MSTERETEAGARRLPGGGYFREHEEGMVVLHGPDGAWLYSSPEHAWVAALAPQPRSTEGAARDQVVAILTEMRSDTVFAHVDGIGDEPEPEEVADRILSLFTSPAEASEPASVSALKQAMAERDPLVTIMGGVPADEAGPLTLTMRATRDGRGAWVFSDWTVEAEATPRPAQGEAERAETAEERTERLWREDGFVYMGGRLRDAREALANMHDEVARLRRENHTLREALEQIANYAENTVPAYFGGMDGKWVAKIARAALASTPQRAIAEGSQ